MRRHLLAITILALTFSAPPAGSLPAGPDARDVLVAVLDTGVDETHPKITGRVAVAKDFTGSRVAHYPLLDHGTMVSGLVIRTAPGVRIASGKIFDDAGASNSRIISAAFRWAVDVAKADVVNASFGSFVDEALVHEAVDYAWSKGVIVVAASGNFGPGEDSAGYPANFDGVIAVGAVDATNSPAAFSSRSKNLFCAERGVAVESTTFGGKFKTTMGTSLAAPVVSGLAARWVRANPRIVKTDRPSKFIAALHAACRDVHTPGWDSATGFGVPDPNKLLGGPR